MFSFIHSLSEFGTNTPHVLTENKYVEMNPCCHKDKYVADSKRLCPLLQTLVSKMYCHAICKVNILYYLFCVANTA